MRASKIKKIKDLLEQAFKQAIIDLEKNDGLKSDSPGFTERIDEIKRRVIRDAGIKETEYDMAEEMMDVWIDAMKTKIRVGSLEKKKYNWNEIDGKPDHVIKPLDLGEMKKSQEGISKVVDTLSDQHLFLSQEIKETDRRLAESIRAIKINHSDLLGIMPDDHHAEKHTLESHKESDLMKEVKRLISGGYVDDLHKHRFPVNAPPYTFEPWGITKGDADAWYLHLDGSNYVIADINWNAKKITNLADPTSDQDAATKAYVDAQITGENWWDRTVTTLSPHHANDNIDIGLGTFTGVNVTSGADPGHTHSIYQPIDDDLTAIAVLGFTSTAFLKKTALNTWALDTNTYLTSVIPHNLLSTTHGDTLADSVAQGDILYGNSTPKWARLAFPATPTGKVIQATATDVAWSSNPITIGTGASISGSNTGDQTITLTSDVTGSGTGSFATTIATNAVTFAKFQQIATASLLGRATAGTGNVENLTDIPTGITIGSAYIYRVGGTDIPITDGGTGLSTMTTAYGVVCAGTTATGSLQVLNALGNAGEVLTSNGAGALPTWQAGGGGGAPTTAHYLTSQAEAGLSAEVNLGALATGLLYGTVAGGVSTISSIAVTPQVNADGFQFAGGTTSRTTIFTGADITFTGSGTRIYTFPSETCTLGLQNTTLSVYASGAAAALTATPALLDFGTTDPSLTITTAGTYLLLSRVRIDYNGSTFAAVRTVTLKLRRTNNTAADVTGATTSALTQIITALTYTMGSYVIPPVIYTTAHTDDIIQIFGSINVVPTAGNIQASEAEIVCIRLY